MNGVFYEVRAQILYPKQVYKSVRCGKIVRESVKRRLGAVSTKAEESPLLEADTRK
jgi:hypothetical protein